MIHIIHRSAGRAAVAAALLAAGLAAAPAARGQETQAQEMQARDGLSEMAREALDLHNAYRARHGSPPLTWSPALAAQAAEWSTSCSYRHAPERGGAGETLAWGLTPQTLVRGAMAFFYDEIEAYDYARPGYSAATGHFTQVVWAATRQLGCGLSPCGGQPMLVCRYLPAGNRQGAFEANVPRPIR